MEEHMEAWGLVRQSDVARDKISPHEFVSG
jgi:hypothetical protein